VRQNSAMLISELMDGDYVYYLSVVTTVVISIVLHELGHGVAAIWQGDDTPRVTGHMTLDPMVHMGGMSLVLLFVIGIAFGQMPVNPSRFRGRFGRALVAAAGPAVNVVLALLGLTALALWLRATDTPLVFESFHGLRETLNNGQFFLFIFGYINIVLFLLNLIPIPPLDGSTVLADLSPGYARFARNPANQGVFMGLFLGVFVLARYLFIAAITITAHYLVIFHA